MAALQAQNASDMFAGLFRQQDLAARPERLIDMDSGNAHADIVESKAGDCAVS